MGKGANVPEVMEKGGRKYRLFVDQLGSVRQVVDVASGQVVQELEYDAWGLVVKDTNPGFQPFGFAGGLYDPQSKLVRFGARDYDPTLGRWTIKDPAGFPDVSVCGFANAFVYSCQQPVDRADYLGLLTIHDGCPKALIEASWADACRSLQNPKCAQTLKGIPTDVWGGSLFDCMRDNCGKSGCLEVRCGRFKEICGKGSPADVPIIGCTVLFALDQSRCEGGPAATMFHEMLHVFGLPDDPRHQRAMLACRGIPQ